jgi:hypothetical protein
MKYRVKEVCIELGGAMPGSRESYNYSVLSSPSTPRPQGLLIRGR